MNFFVTLSQSYLYKIMVNQLIQLDRFVCQIYAIRLLSDNI